MIRLILTIIFISLSISAMGSELLSNKTLKTDTLVDFLAKKISQHENIKKSDISVTTLQIIGTSLDGEHEIILIDAIFKYIPSVKPMRKELLDRINKEGINACKGITVEHEGYSVSMDLQNPDKSFRLIKSWGTGCEPR